nr:XRE family transcriptional regulator [Maliibacterium massiliense]
MRIGQKIKRLRVQHGLTQQELADRTELSKGYISQLESEMTSPSIATLVDILECLGTNLKDFFNEESQERIVFPRADAFVKTNDSLAHTIEWLVPNAQKNSMEPILITLEPGGKSEEDNPHEGEEFGYVLAGSIYICMGAERTRARKGDAFYFSPTMTHTIVNAGKTPASVLWVSCPPSF